MFKVSELLCRGCVILGDRCDAADTYIVEAGTSLPAVTLRFVPPQDKKFMARVLICWRGYPGVPLAPLSYNGGKG